MSKKNKLKKLLDEASKDATHIVSNPDTIKKLKSKGLPIEERFITYEEYFEKLVAEKKKYAVPLLSQLPKLGNSIANSVISAIYEEVRASFGLGIFTSTIFNSIIMLEFAMRTRVFDERLKKDPNSQWEHVEKLKMRNLIEELKKMGIIDDKERLVLVDFNENFRNPYLHINIHEMIKGIYAKGVKKVDIKTSKMTTEKDLDVSKHRHLWFLGKKFYDRSYVIHVLNFCVHWTNKLLIK
ncbi:hypothetical protein KKA02_01545 [Patescibacteria group bacterium]|nr:hypothetical protein [Patescibacteria group bacterium]